MEQRRLMLEGGAQYLLMKAIIFFSSSGFIENLPLRLLIIYIYSDLSFLLVKTPHVFGTHHIINRRCSVFCAGSLGTKPCSKNSTLFVINANMTTMDVNYDELRPKLQYVPRKWQIKDDVVISGMSGRFPKSENIQEFTENLFNGLDMMSSGNDRYLAG